MIYNWSFKSVWNGAALRPDRDVKPREYAWASELGKPLVDRWLSMTGVAATNPPDWRSRRKFLFGNIVEQFYHIVINLLGVRVDTQQEVWTHGIVPVKGKIDFLVQGTPDYELARHNLTKIPFSPEILDYLNSVIDAFEQQIGQVELAPMVRECKSCSHYVIELIGAGGAIRGHQLQLLHYLKGLNIPTGSVDYISKEDSLMEECLVNVNNADLSNQYDSELQSLYGYLNSNTMPDGAPEIIFEGKFKKNLNVEYSNYLTLVYGYKQPSDYADAVTPVIARWNRVLGRIKDINEGKTSAKGKTILLTDKNKIVIDEMSRCGYDAYNFAKLYKSTNQEEEE